MTVTDHVLATCELRRAPWPTPERCCAWCGNELPKRSRRWCSRDCSDDFTRQHNWQWARDAAKARDRHRCVKCGHDPAAIEQQALAALTALHVIRIATLPPIGRHSLLPHTIVARHRATWRLEVNHITPVLGRHGTFGCHHHLDGLETLCHPCHLDVTAEQFGHRRPHHHPTLFDEGAA